MRVLGFDTATWKASVGILVDGQVVAEASRAADGSHAVSLLPLIAEVLSAANCQTSDLDAIAVSGGPGSFTGLRIGFSVAKGLAWATGTGVIAVPTLEALARTVADHEGTVCALLDARKGELYCACFTSAGGTWKQLMPDSLVTPQELLDRLPTPCVIVGDAVVAYEAFLREKLGARVTVLPFETHGPRGGVVASLAWQRLQAGEQPVDLSAMEPVYIRRSEAELHYRG